ncbi:hypothetical protein TEA_001544 [Camellia sinensis var. sinensis]|uniref:Uncharacterized protein n=1 Tax=Camellia sinensis var. sinensis TaxID=542762 RepID=A0A4S4D1P0_CAMSN|nr:hypothetical protein TEA_001544 [Camellia sinensis var. sinensis]
MTSKNEWSSGLFDCFSDASSCCLTIWCPCVTFGRIAEIVDEGGTTCCEGTTWYLLLYGCAHICAPLYSCGYRSKLRNRYSLESTPCNDFLVHFCCEKCALCQEYRELQNRGFNMNKTQKRVTALNRELPRNEQFLLDFEQLQSQFPDQEQLRAVTESILISLVMQCSGHAPRAEFLLFALRSLCSIASIQRGNLDWERALRCIRHALRTTPSTDWWKRVLLVAPCYRPHSQGPTPGAVFTSEMICEATIDRIVELLKLTNSGNILASNMLLVSL